MSDDWFVVAVEGVADAGGEARRAIERSVNALEAGRAARIACRPLVEIVDELIAAGGRETRLRAADAFRAYGCAVADMRGAVVRALVDEGLSLTDVARRLRISRQAAGRLYESTHETECHP